MQVAYHHKRIFFRNSSRIRCIIQNLNPSENEFDSAASYFHEQVNSWFFCDVAERKSPIIKQHFSWEVDYLIFYWNAFFLTDFFLNTQNGVLRVKFEGNSAAGWGFDE